MKHCFAVFVCFLALFVSACGFSPMYGTHGTDPALLNNVEIETISSKYGQQLRNDLMDNLYRDGTPSNPAYMLRVRSLSFAQNRIGLDKTTTAETRFQLTVSANYSLIDKKTRETVYQKNIRSFVSYNALDSQFTTIVARNDARDRGIRQVSDRIVQDLALYFGNPDKESLKPEKEQDASSEEAPRVKVFEE